MRNSKPYFKVGDQVGRLTIKETNLRIGGRMAVLCDCSCGGEMFTREHFLKIGRTISCGCFHREDMSKRFTKHGRTHSEEYIVWQSMLRRCDGLNKKDYHNYGGRGIIVCDKWKESFVNFLHDMGPKPTSNHSLDRINVNGNYSPENCRWATIFEQNNNRRSNRMMTAFGKTQTVIQWSRESGINYQTMINRLNRGWTGEECINIPIQKHK